MAEIAFSDDGKYFSAISQDGRLKIWDTETNVLKQEYTPDLHLSSPPSCLQWIVVSNAAPEIHKKKAKRKSSIVEQEVHCVALGTTNGKILIYNVVDAKIDTILLDTKKGSAHHNKVTSLDWNRGCGLFSCSKDNFIHEWDIQSASVRYKYNVNVDNKNKQASSISAIKLIPHKQNTSSKFIVTASWQLRLWSLDSGTPTIIKNLGHSGYACAVLSLAALENKCYVIEGSQNERLLSFWDVTITEDMLPDTKLNNGDGSPTKKQRKKSISDSPSVTTPAYNFILEDAPKMIDIVVMEMESGVKINLSASTRSGVLHYYGHMLNGASTKPIKPTVTLHVTTNDAKPMPLQCCKFTRSADAATTGEMIVGYEPTPGRIDFERVIPETNTRTQVLIRADPSAEFKKKNRKSEDASKTKTLKPASQQITYVEPMGGVTRKRETPGAKVEVPMEARLANLALDVKARGKTAVNQNLTKLLIQGLHSKDKRLILTVLQKDDPLVAKRTVANLPADYVPQLLQQLIDMASKKTSQCAAVCTWLSALLKSHSALLLATLNTSTTADKFTELLAIMTQRRSHLCQLLNLKGRLDLTISQRGAAEDAEPDDAAILTYADTSSEDEMEVDRRSESLDGNYEESDSEREEIVEEEGETDGD